MVDSAENVINSIRLKIKETSVSPFLFIYLVSWIIYNHEIPIYFFDDHMDAYERTHYLDSYIALKGFKMFACPLASTAIIFLCWIFISPAQLAFWGFSRMLVGWIERHILRHEMIKKEKYIEVENELTSFRIMMLELEKQYKEKISSLDRAKNEASSQNSYLQAELERQSANHKTIEKDLNEDISKKNAKIKCIFHRAEHAENIEKYKKIPDYKGSLIYIRDDAFSLLTNIKNRSVLNDGIKITGHDNNPPINSVLVTISGLGSVADASETIFKSTGLRPSAKIERKGPKFEYSETS